MIPLHQLRQVALSQKKYPRAIALCNLALQMSSGDAATINFRGRANHELGKYNLAIDDFSEAIRLDPKSARKLTSATPVLQETSLVIPEKPHDETEEAMLDFVPFTRSGWEVTYAKRQTQCGRQALQRDLPQAVATAVAAPTIR